MGIPGRPPNFILQRRLAQAILGKEGTVAYKEYVTTMRRQLMAGILPPAIHQLFLHYGFGKPVDHIEVTEKKDAMVDLTEDQLRDRARRLAMAKFILPDREDDETDTPSPASTESDTTTDTVQ